jgi:hypothetical protein
MVDSVNRNTPWIINTRLKYFVTPAGQVVRAFTMENILFRDKDRMIIRYALLRPDLVEAVGTRYVVQKNRRNGQVIWYSKDVANPSFCPVVRALSLVCRALILGQSPSDPICVYRDTTDDTVYLTGAAITEYFRYITKLVYPDIDAAALASISSHSLQVPHAFSLQKLACRYILLNYAYIGSAIISRFIFETH